jgi:hypothetical protein
MKTNDDVQALITKAAQVLDTVPLSHDPVVNLKKDAVKASILLLAAYSMSSNSIPALRGKGLEEVIKLSELIIDKGGDISSVRLNIQALANITIL